MLDVIYKGGVILPQDINKYIDSYLQKANGVYGGQTNSVNAGYDQQKQNLLNSFNLGLQQGQQQKDAIPGQFQPIRNAAYLAAQKSQLAAPAVASNMGYANGAGADYSYRQGVNSTWQKSADTADQAQNAATQYAQNNLNNMQNTYQSNLGDLNTNQAKSLADIETSKQNWAIQNGQNDYNTQLQAEAAQQKQAYDYQAAQQKQAYDYQVEQQRQNDENKKATQNTLERLAKYYTNTNTIYNDEQKPTGESNTISNPDALLNAIYSSGLSEQDQINAIANYPYYLADGRSLADYVMSDQMVIPDGYYGQYAAANNAPHRH